MVFQNFNHPGFPPSGYVHHGLLYANRLIKDPQIFYCPSYTVYPHVYPDGWRFVSPNGFERVATSYAYALNGQVNKLRGTKWESEIKTNARLEKLKIHEALHCCVFIAQSAKAQPRGVWPHKGGINAAFSDGSMSLMPISPQVTATAIGLYDKGSTTDMDYFAFCFFKMLGGDKRWINAYPNLLP